MDVDFAGAFPSLEAEKIRKEAESEVLNMFPWMDLPPGIDIVPPEPLKVRALDWLENEMLKDKDSPDQPRSRIRMGEILRVFASNGVVCSPSSRWPGSHSQSDASKKDEAKNDVKNNANEEVVTADKAQEDGPASQREATGARPPTPQASAGFEQWKKEHVVNVSHPPRRPTAGEHLSQEGTKQPLPRAAMSGNDQESEPDNKTATLCDCKPPRDVPSRATPLPPRGSSPREDFFTPEVYYPMVPHPHPNGWFPAARAPTHNGASPSQKPKESFDSEKAYQDLISTLRRWRVSTTAGVKAIQEDLNKASAAADKLQENMEAHQQALGAGAVGGAASRPPVPGAGPTPGPFWLYPVATNPSFARARASVVARGRGPSVHVPYSPPAPMSYERGRGPRWAPGNTIATALTRPPAPYPPVPNPRFAPGFGREPLADVPYAPPAPMSYERRRAPGAPRWTPEPLISDNDSPRNTGHFTPTNLSCAFPAPEEPAGHSRSSTELAGSRATTSQSPNRVRSILNPHGPFEEKAGGEEDHAPGEGYTADEEDGGNEEDHEDEEIRTEEDDEVMSDSGYDKLDVEDGQSQCGSDMTGEFTLL